MPLFGICTMDPTFKVDLEYSYSCSSSSYLQDQHHQGSEGPVAPLMGRTPAASPTFPLTPPSPVSMVSSLTFPFHCSFTITSSIMSLTANPSSSNLQLHAIGKQLALTPTDLKASLNGILICWWEVLPLILKLRKHNFSHIIVSLRFSIVQYP